LLSYVVYYYSCDTAFNSMKKYEVEITVTNTYSLSIEADTINEARTFAETEGYSGNTDAVSTDVEIDSITEDKDE